LFSSSVINRGVSRRLHQRRRLKIFNFFCSSAAAFKNSQVIGGGGSKISIFFRLSAAAAEIFFLIFPKNFLFPRNF
jgi:hypothetical protein